MVNWLFLLISASLVIGSCATESNIIQKVQKVKPGEKGEPWFPIWGVYCGLWHTDHYGKEPVDQMDRYCQFHDICVTLESQGYRSCWCNEQIYFLVSNFRPMNKTESDIKDSILYYIYAATADCENHWGFDTHIKVTRVRPDVDERGFNYITFYPQGYTEKFIISLNQTNGPANMSLFDQIQDPYAPSYLLRLTSDQYNQFVIDVHTDPVNNIKNYTGQIVHILDYSEYVFKTDENYYVIYNSDQNVDMTYYVKNITDCCTCTDQTYYEKIENHAIEIVLGTLLGVFIIFGFILSLFLCVTCLFYKKLRRDYHESKLSNDTGRFL